MLSTLLIVAATCPQEPQANPAHLAWETLQQRLSAAQALHLEAVLVMSDPEAPVGEARNFRMTVEIAIAQPGAGMVHFAGRVEGPEGDREELVMNFLGTGEGIYYVDHEEKLAMHDGEAWNASQISFFFPFLGDAWSFGGLTGESWEFLPADAEHADWRGIRVNGTDFLMEAAFLEVWLDERGDLRRTSVPMGPSARMESEFSRFETLEEAVPEQYLQLLPEGYEIVGPEDEEQSEEFSLGGSLLPAGADAPEVTFVGMDDVAFTLASLRGKTVLLNFWFYH
jgi:hypothetical protein